MVQPGKCLAACTSTTGPERSGKPVDAPVTGVHEFDFLGTYAAITPDGGRIAMGASQFHEPQYPSSQPSFTPSTSPTCALGKAGDRCSDDDDCCAKKCHNRKCGGNNRERPSRNRNKSREKEKKTRSPKPTFPKVILPRLLPLLLPCLPATSQVCPRLQARMLLQRLQQVNKPPGFV
jgi:hypothetical protein